MMTFNIDQLQKSALLVVVGEDGLFEWSSTKTNAEVAAYLRGLADGIEAGE